LSVSSFFPAKSSISSVRLNRRALLALSDEGIEADAVTARCANGFPFATADV
jgi:hypothetical protein